MGVDRPVVRQHFEKIGQALAWHGSLSIDYFWDERTGQPSYIDANPRITEPMNAVVNGINLADLQVQLSLGREITSLPRFIPHLKATVPSRLYWGLPDAITHGRMYWEKCSRSSSKKAFINPARKG